MNIEVQILQEAVRQFTAITGATLQQVRYNDLIIRESRPAAAGTDAELLLQPGTLQLHFFAIVKNEIREMHIPHLLETMGDYFKNDRILVCRYIPRPLKDDLRKKGINYLDAAGNCFIRKEGIYFFINDQAVTPPRVAHAGKLWKPAGLKFIFAVLQQPELLNGVYRQLALAAGVALGNIGVFIEELKAAGFIRQQEGGIVIQNKEKLLHRWVELYHAVLRPKLQLGRFRFINDTAAVRWKEAAANTFFWGGEPAGAILTNFLQPGLFTVYTHQQTEVMKELRVIPDENGPMEMLEIFWNEKMLQTADPKNTVPPLLVYADLIAHADSRNQETAVRIKQQYLA